MNDFRADFFTETAVLKTRTQTGANDLGEAEYSVVHRTIKGLFVARPKVTWQELGLGASVQAVFMTSEKVDFTPGMTLTVGGREYRKIEVAQRTGLFADTITRLVLQAEDA